MSKTKKTSEGTEESKEATSETAVEKTTTEQSSEAA